MMRLWKLIKRSSLGRSALHVLQPGAKLRLSSGRIVHIKPLNLKNAIVLLSLFANVMEKVGWESLSSKSVFQFALEALSLGSEQLVDAISIITGEQPEIIANEFSPADIVLILSTLWKQESTNVPKDFLSSLRKNG